MHIITIDYESYWRHQDYTLSKMGPIEYIRDPRFEVQLMGIRIDRGKTEVFETHEIPAVLQALDLANRKDCIVVGHNLNGFDALILSEHYGIVPHLCLDTMTVSRWIGLSRLGNESHARLTKLLGTGEKKAGTVVSDGKHWPHDFTSEERKFFKQYCADDVTQCSENMHTMLESGLVTKDAILFSNIICRMGTQPIFRLVPSLLDTYVKELEERAERARLDLSRIFHFHTKEEFLQNIRSADKFCAMMRTLGMEPPMKVSAARTKTARAKLEAEYVSLSDAGYAVVNGYAGDDVKQKRINEVVGMLANPASYEVLAPALSKNDYEFVNLQNHEDDRIALLVQSRLENNSSIQMSRALRFVTLAKSGKPLPVMLNCFKAHTSRLTAGNSEGASDSINLQNLSKRNPKMLTLRRAIIAPKGYKVVAADSSQIEARLLAYIARQDDLLDKFRTGEDPYSQLAENIFNVPWKEIKAGNKAGDPRMTMYRNVGKKAILSAGYQVGWRKFSNSLLGDGVKLHADLEQHHQMAKHAHSVYRLTHGNIVQFWGRCLEVIRAMYLGSEGTFGGPNDDYFQFKAMPFIKGNLYDGAENMAPSVKMPSGYILRYPGLHVQTDGRREEFFYKRPFGKNMVDTKIYGGLLCENLIQGLAFQLLMWQACRMYEHGIPLKANVHDAWITVVPEADAERVQSLMEADMSSVPDWLPGFPVACDSKVGDDYTIA